MADHNSTTLARASSSEATGRSSAAAKPARRRWRVVFYGFADRTNTNAQNQNIREIGLQLDPSRFECVFFASEPDPRLARENIRVVRLPRRLKSVVFAAQLLWGKHDLTFCPHADMVVGWYLALRRLGRSKKLVSTFEGTADQILAAEEASVARMKELAAAADSRISISAHIAVTVRERLGLASRVASIGFDGSVFKPTDRRGRSGVVRVLFVGSLQKRKQVDVLLDVAAALVELPVEFHLVGGALHGSDYETSLRERVAREGLDNVIFRGRMGSGDVAATMQACDVFALPSRLEGTPKVVLEAAGTGLPCVIFDDYRCPHVVEGETGFSVRTVAEFRNRIEELVRDRELRLRMGEAAARFSQQFEWAVVGRVWESEFLRVLESVNLKSDR